MLDGIIYLQCITDRRMRGVAVRNQKLFKGICRDKPLKSTVVVTTMWDLLGNEAMGETREEEMKKDPEFFAPMVKQGTEFARHNNTKESAHQIIFSLIIKGQRRKTLAIQKGTLDDGRHRWTGRFSDTKLIRTIRVALKGPKERGEKEGSAVFGENNQAKEQVDTDYFLIAYALLGLFLNSSNDSLQCYGSIWNRKIHSK
jgi:hypothetical protein